MQILLSEQFVKKYSLYLFVFKIQEQAYCLITQAMWMKCMV